MRRLLKLTALLALWRASMGATDEVISRTAGKCKAPEDVFGDERATSVVIALGPIGLVFACLRWFDYTH